jgi:hypothetical protein
MSYALAERPLPFLIESLLAYWASKLTDGNTTCRGEDFSPDHLRPWLTNLAVIERISDREFRIIAAGKNLRTRFKCETSGRQLNDLGEDILVDLEERVTRAMTEPGPVLAAVTLASSESRYIELLLPLCRSDGVVDRTLFVSYPDEPYCPATIH